MSDSPQSSTESEFARFLERYLDGSSESKDDTNTKSTKKVQDLGKTGNSWVTVCRKKKKKYPRRRTFVLIPVPLKMCIVCGLPVNEELFGYKDEGLMLKNEEIERVNKLGIKKLLRLPPI